MSDVVALSESDVAVSGTAALNFCGGTNCAALVYDVPPSTEPIMPMSMSIKLPPEDDEPPLWRPLSALPSVTPSAEAMLCVYAAGSAVVLGLVLVI